MEYRLNTRLEGTIAVTSRFHEDRALQENRNLYKFVWVRHGNVEVEVDHVVLRMEQDEILPLMPLHHVVIRRVEGEYLALLFDSNFYCIYGHDDEVSCGGVLFNGSSDVQRLQLSPAQSENLSDVLRLFRRESAICDNLQEEMLRILLKRFIIACTRIARERFAVADETERSFDIVRRFYVLVDTHFREKKSVQEYAGLLCRSPKTLSNLFASYGLPSPLRVIRRRVLAAAKRLLLYTDKSAKEVGDLLGFEEVSAFSRFFRQMTSESITDYRRREKRE